MENKINFLLFFLIVFSIVSCNSSKIIVSPLWSVVKLNDAMQSKDFETALKYIDIESVCSKVEVENPVEEWKKAVSLQYSLGKTKKFSNTFGYDKYNVYESIKNKKAELIFVSKNTENRIEKIIYKLELRNSVWVVVDINYITK